MTSKDQKASYLCGSVWLPQATLIECAQCEAGYMSCNNDDLYIFQLPSIAMLLHSEGTDGRLAKFVNISRSWSALEIKRFAAHWL